MSSQPQVNDLVNTYAPGSQGAGALCHPPCLQHKLWAPPEEQHNAAQPVRLQDATSSRQQPERQDPRQTGHKAPPPEATGCTRPRSTCGNSHSSPIACNSATLESATAAQSGHDG